MRGRSAEPVAGEAAALRASAAREHSNRILSLNRIRSLALSSWVGVAWVVFIGLNLLAMRVFPAWQTVPFLIIWVSLTAIYGFRLWRLGSTLATVAVVTLATGGLIGWQVLRGQPDGDYLAEVPLLATMFVIMVWHARRRQSAMAEMKRISEHNLLLLDQQRQFLQDVSHELGTPITIALGHAELIEHATTDQAIAEEARVAVAELMVETLHRWSQTPRRWSLGTLAEVSMPADADRLMLALDALIENAVDHTGSDDRIELSATAGGDKVILAVSDSGSGIAAADLSRIFGRFSRIDAGRSREIGGFGLGLAVVKAIAEAHHGSVQVRSTVGKGSVFELMLPTSPAAADTARQSLERRAVPR